VRTAPGSRWRIPYKKGLAHHEGSRSSSPALVFAPRSSLFSPTHRNRLDHLPVALPTGEAGRSSARQRHDLRLPGRAEGWLRPPEARPCRARGKLRKRLIQDGRFCFCDCFACTMVLLVRWFCLWLCFAMVLLCYGFLRFLLVICTLDAPRCGE
jgi:hypothetical protein